MPRVGSSQRNERNVMMNYSNGWMGGGMWMVISVLVVVLLVVLISKLSRK